VKKGTCTSIRGTNLAPLHLRVGVAVCFIFCSRLGCVERERFSNRTAHRCASVSCALPSRWRARGPAHHPTCWEPATGPPVLINQAVALKRVRGRRLDVFFPRMSFFLRAFCTLSRLPSVQVRLFPTGDRWEDPIDTRDDFLLISFLCSSGLHDPSFLSLFLLARCSSICRQNTSR